MTYPIGIAPPWDRDRKDLVYNFYNGETMEIRQTCYLKSGSVATSDNCTIDFILRDQRFANTEIWNGTLDDGVEFVDETEFPGLISILLPAIISDSLRRGSYIFSIMVTSAAEPHDVVIVKEGILLIEYAATSPTRNIPYRSE